MRTTASHPIRTLLAATTAAALLAACGDAAAPAAPAAAVAPSARVAGPDVCPNVQPPAGNELSARLFARGVQIYRWDGTSWTFVEPSAVLYANAQGRGTVGTHFAGPTWLSVSGSKVVAKVAERCTPDAGSIPWLLLRATSAEGPGVFHGTTFIQRVNTVGGNAPTTPGTATGEVASVPYTAEYLFYRAH